MDEEDEAFQLPTGGTRLASLFGQDQTATESENVLFQYMPPKRPKKGQPATAAGLSTQKHPPAAAAAAVPAVVPAAAPGPTPATLSIFFAANVHAYLLTKRSYVKDDKYGAAIVGSNATKEYRVLLHTGNLQQIATARIDAAFFITVYPHNCCTFFDDENRFWAIKFESEMAAVDFSKQLCIAKYNSRPSPDSVLYQDLVLGDGQEVEAGDALEITFTGWLFQNGSLGQVFDSNVDKGEFLHMKLGSGEVIKGWEDGMIGMKKGGRRFLLVPPALAYGPLGEAERIPPDSTLAFEVEVKRVRFAKDAGFTSQSLDLLGFLACSPTSQSESPATDPAWLTRPSPAPNPGEPAVRAESSSISEQLANPDVTKVKLISRMTKMGQPMLPVLSSTFAPQQDSVDKEIEEPNAVQEFSTFCPKDYRPMAPPQWATQALHPAVSGLQAPTVPQPHPPLPRSPQNCQPYAGKPYAYPQVSAAVSQLQPVGLCPAPFQAAEDIGSFLRGQFNLESHTGQEVLGIVLNTIKTITLQLLESWEEQRRRSSTKEEGPAERKQPSATAIYGDSQSNSLREPAPMAFPAPLANLKESSSSPPLTALEGAQDRQFSAAPEAHTLEAPGEQTPAASAQTAKPPLRFSTSIEKEKPSTQGEMDTTDTAILAPPKPVADETAPAVEGPTAGPEGEEESGASQHTAGPSFQAALADKQQDLAGASQSRAASSPMQADSSLLEDKGSFFKVATPKPSALGTLLAEDEEEEEEEERALRGCSGVWCHLGWLKVEGIEALNRCLIN